MSKSSLIGAESQFHWVWRKKEQKCDDYWCISHSHEKKQKRDIWKSQNPQYIVTYYIHKKSMSNENNPLLFSKIMSVFIWAAFIWLLCLSIDDTMCGLVHIQWSKYILTKSDDFDPCTKYSNVSNIKSQLCLCFRYTTDAQNMLINSNFHYLSLLLLASLVLCVICSCKSILGICAFDNWYIPYILHYQSSIFCLFVAPLYLLVEMLCWI